MKDETDYLELYVKNILEWDLPYKDISLSGRDKLRGTTGFTIYMIGHHMKKVGYELEEIVKALTRSQEQ